MLLAGPVEPLVSAAPDNRVTMRRRGAFPGVAACAGERTGERRMENARESAAVRE